MKFTQVASDALEKLTLNAGVLLTEFDPSTGTLDRTKIIGATSGGTSFEATPEWADYGDDIDNVPANTKELKVLQSVSVKLSTTLKTIDSPAAKMIMAAADISGDKITPRADLLPDDFNDIWIVADYSEYHGDTKGGFVAIHVINALSTGGFKMQSNNKGKADFDVEFMGHYSITDMSVLPYEIYIKEGAAE